MSDAISCIIAVLQPCFIAFISQTGPVEAFQEKYEQGVSQCSLNRIHTDNK